MFGISKFELVTDPGSCGVHVIKCLFSITHWTTHLNKPKLTIFVFCAITNSEKEKKSNSSYKLDTVHLDLHHLKTAVKQKWHR